MTTVNQVTNGNVQAAAKAAEQPTTAKTDGLALDLKDSGGKVSTTGGSLVNNGDGTATLKDGDTNFTYTGVKERADGGFTASGGTGTLNGQEAKAKQNHNGDALIVAAQNDGEFKVDGWFTKPNGQNIGDIHTTGTEKKVEAPTPNLDVKGKVFGQDFEGKFVNNGDGTATLTGQDTNFKYTGVKVAEDGTITAAGGDGTINGKQVWAKQNGRGNALEINPNDDGTSKYASWFKDAHGKHVGDLHGTATPEPVKPAVTDYDINGKVFGQDFNGQFVNNGDGTGTLTGDNTNFTFTGVEVGEDGKVTATGGDGTINGKQVWAKQNGNGDALVINPQDDGNSKFAAWFKDEHGAHVGDLHATATPKEIPPVTPPATSFEINGKVFGQDFDGHFVNNGDGTGTLTGDNTNFTFTGVEVGEDGKITATGGDGTINGKQVWAKQNGNGDALVINPQDDGNSKFAAWFKDEHGTHVGDLHGTATPKPEVDPNIVTDERFGFTYNKETGEILDGEYKGYNYIQGTDGDDTLKGTNGNDFIVAGKGNDVIYGKGGDDVIFGDDGDDVIFGGKGNDVINGGRGHDILKGGRGDDKIKGGRGNDYIDGGRGKDTIEGGRGHDILKGGRGDDTIKGGSGHDYIDGGRGKDTIEGGRGDDFIWGGRGDDTIKGGSGHDYIDGGRGNDNIEGGRGNDFIWGGRGDDTIKGGSGHDYIDGGRGNDNIEGGRGNDSIWGGRGNDTIKGGRGHDYIDGGRGKDIIEGGAGHDDLFGGRGSDKIWGGAGNDYIRGGRGHDQVWGQNGHDQIHGDRGNDILDGGRGNDSIWGGRGHDQIDGGPGCDNVWYNSAQNQLWWTQFNQPDWWRK